MAKYVFDVQFDIPRSVLATLPQENPMNAIKASASIERISLAKTDEEYSEVRFACEGTDAGCQKAARSLTLTIGKQKFKAVSNEIVHCQG